ncbi:hypothetical protein [Microvirga sp. VF16]|uniref:hypothetical protein n=1 Tax=Microvirga sp. VF16 TaxID=2807101 RepID=UPI00193C9CCA|nr:hypothetical protein [Microvirga sp. VF16]QRM32509.1 hypothetical protein JO965_30955 [Microvirga sp. VF16]
MALLRRELHRTAKGPGANAEDTWTLVFDTDTKRLFVEHAWQHVDVRRGDASDNGTQQLDIAEYLLQGGQTAGHRELWRLIKILFDEPGITQKE